METLILGLWFGSVACLAWALLPNITNRLIRQRVLASVSDERKPTLLNQLAEIFAPINRWLPTGWYGAHIKQLLEAGAMRVSAMAFVTVQEIGALAGLLVYMVTLGWSDQLNLGWLIIFPVGGFFIPYLWLSNRVKARRLTIARDLPELVDLLCLCVDAGIDFMSSLGRVVKEFRPCPSTEELGTVLQEVRVGKRRRDALKAFSNRLQMPESSTFARTLIQADRIGTGTADSLKVLAEDMRLQRYHRADRFAQKAPLKMLIPLMLSLAAAMLIVTSPILIQFFQGGFTSPQFSLSQEGGGGGP